MKRTITFKGSPLSLVGRSIKENFYAPNFTVTSSDLKDVMLSDFEDKIKVITTFPSLDTPVCDLQVKEFNTKTVNLSNDVIIVGISKDLPFAQKRFCNEFSIGHILIFSDYKTSSFGLNYGLLIKELNLFSESPSYDDVLHNLQTIIKKPTIAIPEQKSHQCIPCVGVVSPLTKNVVAEQLSHIHNWDLIHDNKIVKTIKTNDYSEARYIINTLSVIADEQGHHPALSLMWNKVKITLTTHAAGGLTENDFIMARIIDDIISIK